MTECNQSQNDHVRAAYQLVGVVVIGRNEGDRLIRCLESSLKLTRKVVYVDSGSTDNSVNEAISREVLVVDLDTSVPFTAARARNEGVSQLIECWPEVEYVHVIDGDCEFQDGWIQIAFDFIESTNDAAVVCGRRRERFPEHSKFNQLCDLEWDTPVGQAKSCGGDALFSLQVFNQVGGYNSSVIAGEEPELCVRIRKKGYTVHRLDHEMTLHDAAMDSFEQFWKRAKRAGHAYAQGAYLHGRPPERHGVKQTRSAIVWGFVFPVIAFVFAIPTLGISLALYIVLYLFQSRRIRDGQCMRGRSKGHAKLLARYTMIAKFAQAQGVMLFHYRHIMKKQATLIEYKATQSKHNDR